MVYEIEFKERAAHAAKLVHPILKRGHSNVCEASHNLRFWFKDILFKRLHYELSTNLGLLQFNMTYVHAKLSTSYHWIQDFYSCIKLPVFEAIIKVLQEHNLRRKRKLEMAKTIKGEKREGL